MSGNGTAVDGAQETLDRWRDAAYATYTAWVEAGDEALMEGLGDHGSLLRIRDLVDVQEPVLHCREFVFEDGAVARITMERQGDAVVVSPVTWTETEHA